MEKKQATGTAQMGKKGDDNASDNVLNFMTWIVIAWMVWSAAKVIDNVLSKEEGEGESVRVRTRPSMIETIRMNDGKLDMVREFVWSLVVISKKKEENFWLWRASKPARANDDERLKRKRKDKSSINKSKCHISTSFSCHTDWILWMLFYSTQKGIEKDEKKFCIMKYPTEIQRRDHMCA